MPTNRLPTPGQDSGNWGTMLNGFLTQSLDNTNGGGINKFDTFSLRPTTLGADDKGKTYLYTQTGNFHQWSGTEWKVLNESVINVKDYGAVGDGVSDDTAAIQSCLNDASKTNLFFPVGRYKISTITITKNNTNINGSGNFDGGTVFICTSTNGDNIVLDNCQQCLIQNIQIVSVVVKNSGFALVLKNDCFATLLNNIRIDYGYNGIGIAGGTESKIINCQLRYMFGNKGVYFGNDNGKSSYRAVIENLIADNPYPVNYNQIKTLGNSVAFSAGDIVLVNNKIWQCVQAGNSTDNTSLFQIPNVPADQVSNTAIDDGGCKFKFVSGTMNWIFQDSLAYSLVISKAALLNGYIGYSMNDTLNTSNSKPTWAFAWDLELDHNFYAGVLQDAGEGLYINGSWIGSCLNWNGILIEGSGELFVGGGTRIMGNAEHGVLINSGVNNKVSDCFIGANSQKTNGQYNGITVGANLSKFYLLNNKIGVLNGGGNTQKHGVFVNDGCTKYIISNNDLSENISPSQLGVASGNIVINSNML